MKLRSLLLTLNAGSFDRQQPAAAEVEEAAMQHEQIRQKQRLLVDGPLARAAHPAFTVTEARMDNFPTLKAGEYQRRLMRRL